MSSSGTLTYRFHCAPQAHFSHDRVDVETEQGMVTLAISGTKPAEIELRGQYYRTLVFVEEVLALVHADREFIPALLRAKQEAIERDLEISQRRVEKLLTARDKLRALTAE